MRAVGVASLSRIFKRRKSVIHRTIYSVLAAIAMALTLTMIVSAFQRVSTGYIKAPLVQDIWVEFRAERMRIEFNRHVGAEPPTAEAAFYRAILQSPPQQFAGISWSKNRIVLTAAPSILLIILLVTYPAYAFVRGPWRRHRRRKRGLCVACGYDLTGNESGRCSECGEGF